VPGKVAAGERMTVSIDPTLPAVAVLGEILWDLVGETRRLGGAPLNFAAHLRHLGHNVSLVSGLGTDAPGREAAARVAGLGLDTRLLQTTSRLPTGTAQVALGLAGDAEFKIVRPAAYDAVELSDRELELLHQLAPGWLYFGTLFAATDTGRHVLDRLIDALPGAQKFYDVNLRPGADAPALVAALLAEADVVKLNEDELRRVHGFAGLPAGTEAFCRAACERYDWRAVAVTRGERGSAVLVGGQFIEAPGVAVTVADTVGAGDAFAAAFVHGLSRRLPAGEIAAFANRVAAKVASRHGSLPD
jgi:fructokinase